MFGNFSEQFSEFISQIKNLPQSFNYVVEHPSSAILLVALLIILALAIRLKKVNFNAHLVAQIGIALALASVLQILRIYHWPQGGSITIGSMVPILFIGIVYGPEIGLFTGFLFGLLNLLLDPFILTPVQMLLDYPLAYMSLGLVGFFKKNYMTGALVSLFGRFFFHFISGLVFFSSYAVDAGMTPFLYSLMVNGIFIGVEGCICLIVLKCLPINRLKKSINKGEMM